MQHKILGISRKFLVFEAFPSPKQTVWVFWFLLLRTGKCREKSTETLKFHFFRKNENHHLGRASNAKTWNISENIRFWWVLGTVKTRFQLYLGVCWIKYCQSVIALTNILEFTKKNMFFFLSLHFYGKSHRFSKGWASIQTHAKPHSPQNHT